MSSTKIETNLDFNTSAFVGANIYKANLTGV